jgi:hypothetical protein
MALNPLPTANTLKQRLDAADLNTLADAMRVLGFGTVLRQMVGVLRRQNPFAQPASPYDLATLKVIQLPDDAKAMSIDPGAAAPAYVRTQDASASTGAAGVYTYKTPAGTTATTGTVGISPAGNITFLATDAPNDVDLEYNVFVGDMVELTLNAVAGTGVCALPASVVGAGPGMGAGPGVLFMSEAEILVGTAVGKKIVLVPAAGAPAAGNARLDVAKLNVQFAVADGATSVRVKLMTCSKIDVNALLEAASPVL